MKAPIVEAVIDFRFSAVVAPEKIQQICKRLEDRYPLQDGQTQLGVFVSQELFQIAQQPSGSKLQSLDGVRIALIQPTGITNSRLAPYAGWEDLKRQTDDVLKDAERILGRTNFNRIGVRFINRLDIPGDELKIDDWITLAFSIPDGISDVAESFGLQLVFPTSKQMHATVNYQSMPSPLLMHSSLLLDIDIYTTGQNGIQNSDIADILLEMRNEKNRIFEACITDKARRLFEPDYVESSI
jgi:uncharacterized protein (TIGR04255 family)